MESSDVYRLLARRIRRGMVIFPTIWFVSIVLGGLALEVPGIGAWAAAVFLTATLCRFLFVQVREREFLARQISEEPALVSCASLSNTKLALIADRFLTLHLNDGQEFEVGLSPAEMRTFVIWLTERNPSVRCEVENLTEKT